MGQGGIDVGAVVASAQQQNPPRVVSPGARAVSARHQRQERGGARAHLLEGGAKLVDVDGGVAPGASVQAERIHLVSAPARAQIVARHASQIRPVDEKLGLRDAQRSKVGDVIVGTG